jgi:hypothetical protein
MADLNVPAVLGSLKGFQRDAVDHVFDRFYGAGGSRSGRFLVADETGLGKSIVARGIIARAIEHLETVDEVERIDIVYMCSNADLARQNLQRLNVTGDSAVALTTRLSLLALYLPQLRTEDGATSKKVNLVSFTPGTSGFNVGGNSAGQWRERALLALLLREVLGLTGDEWGITATLFAQGLRTRERFEQRVRDLQGEIRHASDDQSSDLAPETVAGFRLAIAGALSEEFSVLIADALAGAATDDVMRWRAAGTIGRLRRALAKASLQALEPDLIILDEFQRFRDLLQPPEASEAAQLAHDLFSYKDARVLLLSATPYKPFTRASEEEDHHRDFMQTIAFLANHDAAAVDGVRNVMDTYRSELVGGGTARDAAEGVREALLPYMSRSERPQPPGTFEERRLVADPPTADDVVEFAQLRDLGTALGAPIDLEYWKSIPYFANFMDGYKAGDRARALFREGEAEDALRILQNGRRLDRDRLAAQQEIDLGNGYLRTTATDTIEKGWSSLLWVPPSMPYLGPAGPFRDRASMTKRVIFSAWSGVPTAVSSLLSYAAERLTASSAQEVGGAPSSTATTRLNYSDDPGETSSLSTLALFFPMPSLADVGDPLRLVRAGRERQAADQAEDAVRSVLSKRPESGQPWDALFSSPEGLPAGLTALALEALGDPDPDEVSGSVGLQRHLDAAIHRMQTAAVPTNHRDLARFALHAPGMTAYRSVRRIAVAASPDALWTAAFRIANGLRSLFNRPEALAILRQAYGDRADGEQYWSAVLRYCADGNLQSLLDEYLHQLASERGALAIDDTAILEIAGQVADVLGLRVVNYVAHDTDRARTQIRMKARFALRYGARASTSSEENEARQADVRSAFNSPFAPFVLVSTSVGQEGIDFHWWSHAVVHWNVPSNPVDFEQREGRVNRYAGHAIRRNVAARHWRDVLESGLVNPWDAAFEAASASDVAAKYPAFAPWWIYPGDAKIQRIVMEHPLSADGPRYERLQKSLALYRLTLGQPRQEDMVALLAQRGVDGDAVSKIDLRPPHREGHDVVHR